MELSNTAAAAKKYFPVSEGYPEFALEGDLIRLVGGRHNIGWCVLVLEVSRKRGGSTRFYAYALDSGKLYTVTVETAKEYIPHRVWRQQPGHTNDQANVAAELRTVFEEGQERAQANRTRVGARRKAGKTARAQGRNHWRWSEYGC